MRCRLAQQQINEYVDGTLEDGRLSALTAHLEGCAGCRAFLADLERMAAGAKGLEQVEPPERVWIKIRAGLRERRAAGRGRVELDAAPPRSRFGLRFALASTAAVLVVAGGLLVFRPWKPGLPRFEAERAALDRQTLEKLNEAEWHYHEAIKALQEAVGSQRGSLDPEMAGVFAANLGIVDATIEACRQAAQSDPRDLKARNALLASYGEKVQVLNAWVSAQKMAASEGRPGVKL